PGGGDGLGDACLPPLAFAGAREPARPQIRPPPRSLSLVTRMVEAKRPFRYRTSVVSSVLFPDQVEHLVALPLHHLPRASLEVQAEQRLGVRRAHVEVPVVRRDREAVEVRDHTLGAEALLQLLQLQGPVRTGR